MALCPLLSHFKQSFSVGVKIYCQSPDNRREEVPVESTKSLWHINGSRGPVPCPWRERHSLDRCEAGCVPGHQPDSEREDCQKAEVHNGHWAHGGSCCAIRCKDSGVSSCQETPDCSMSLSDASNSAKLLSKAGVIKASPSKLRGSPRVSVMSGNSAAKRVKLAALKEELKLLEKSSAAIRKAILDLEGQEWINRFVDWSNLENICHSNKPDMITPFGIELISAVAGFFCHCNQAKIAEAFSRTILFADYTKY